MKLSSSDRKSLIKLASGLPKGSAERRAILNGLGKAGASLVEQGFGYSPSPEDEEPPMREEYRPTTNRLTHSEAVVLAWAMEVAKPRLGQAAFSRVAYRRVQLKLQNIMDDI